MKFDLEFALGFCIFIMCIFLGISLLIETHNRSIIEDEKKCVEFYKKNNYILDSCEKYYDKLKKEDI